MSEFSCATCPIDQSGIACSTDCCEKIRELVEDQHKLNKVRELLEDDPFGGTTAFHEDNWVSKESFFRYYHWCCEKIPKLREAAGGKTSK